MPLVNIVGMKLLFVFTASDATAATEGGEQEPLKAAGEVGPQLRRRRSLLASLERIGRAEEEEEREEEFQLPRQQEDSGFSVNKCILAALILLGLGTIFFSGINSLQFTGQRNRKSFGVIAFDTHPDRLGQ